MCLLPETFSRSNGLVPRTSQEVQIANSKKLQPWQCIRNPDCCVCDWLILLEPNGGCHFWFFRTWGLAGCVLMRSQAERQTSQVIEVFGVVWFCLVLPSEHTEEVSLCTWTRFWRCTPCDSCSYYLVYVSLMLVGVRCGWSRWRHSCSVCRNFASAQPCDKMVPAKRHCEIHVHCIRKPHWTWNRVDLMEACI